MRDATKGYKNLEKLLGKHDLDPAIENPPPSPLEIAEALRNGSYKQENVDDIKSKLQKAVNHAQTAASPSGDHDRNHQLRIDTYSMIVNVIVVPVGVFDTRAVESESLKVGKSLKIGKNRIKIK